MNVVYRVLLLLAVLFVNACGEEDSTIARPAPQELQGDEIGYFCNMLVKSHAGPKAQVFLAGEEMPLWFSSVRDGIAFMRLPEETRKVAALYVTDVGRADWNAPEPGTWIEVGEAWYVVGSRRRGGMGAPELVPFSKREDAVAFSSTHGGQVMALADVPDDAVLGAVSTPGSHSPARTAGHNKMQTVSGHHQPKSESNHAAGHFPKHPSRQAH